MAKKKAVKNPRVPRTRNAGTLTEAGLKSAIIASLRRVSMYWKPKAECLKKARTGGRIKTKKGGTSYELECSCCRGKFPQNEMHADHITPVVSLSGIWGNSTSFLGINWNEYIERLLVEEDGFQALSKECHAIKTKKENETRRENKKAIEKKKTSVQ